MHILYLEELLVMGADKVSTDSFTLNGLLYVRSTSFSQKLKAAVEKIYREYQEKKLNVC